MSDSNFADYSACITAVFNNECFYIIDIFRDKLIFPDLKKKIISLHNQYNPNKLIIENKGSGISLVQQLKSEHKIYPIKYTLPYPKKNASWYIQAL